MKVSHLLYKVNNLETAINNFKELGYRVDYGSKYKPHNALIYFSEGPYIELLEKAPVSFMAKTVLKWTGNKKVVDRFELWEKNPEGFFAICLENYESDFKREEAILKKYGQGFFKTKSHRIDPSNRNLKWKLLFPYEVQLPFLMTYFNVDPKPKDFIHPNGIKKIKRVSLGTDPNLIPIINELCDDYMLDVSVVFGEQNYVSCEFM